MQETLSRETLSQSDKAMLEKILVKGPNEMNQEEEGIVRARRMYLTPIERSTFAGVLEVGNPPEGGTGEEPKLAEEDKPKYSKMTNAQLVEVLEKRGVVIPEEYIKADLLKLIEENE